MYHYCYICITYVYNCMYVCMYIYIYIYIYIYVRRSQTSQRSLHRSRGGAAWWCRPTRSAPSGSSTPGARATTASRCGVTINTNIIPITIIVIIIIIIIIFINALRSVDAGSVQSVDLCCRRSSPLRRPCLTIILKTLIMIMLILLTMLILLSIILPLQQLLLLIITNTMLKTIMMIIIILSIIVIINQLRNLTD